MQGRELEFRILEDVADKLAKRLQVMAGRADVSPECQQLAISARHIAQSLGDLAKAEQQDGDQAKSLPATACQGVLG